MTLQFPAPVRRFLSLTLLGTAGLLSASCDKDDNKDYGPIDEKIITDYLAANMITTAQRQPSGLYYVPVVSAPANVRAVAGNTVSVLYTGKLMDGTVFDATSRRNNVPIRFVLGSGQVIAGWDQGIALMRKGEKAVLLIPSALGYGKQAKGSIPANSVLNFEVELVDVQ